MIYCIFVRQVRLKKQSHKTLTLKAKQRRFLLEGAFNEGQPSDERDQGSVQVTVDRTQRWGE